MKAAQDALLAKHNQSSAKSPETAHHVECEYGPEEKLNVTGHAFGKDSAVKEEKAQRHDHAEEEKHFIAQRQLHAHAREGHEVGQSRNLLPVSSMKTSSREGVAISRLTNSLPCASRHFTRETIAGAVRGVCRT